MPSTNAIRLVHQQEQHHEPIDTGITLLRQRMLEDMRVRKLEPKTQTWYVRAARVELNR